MYWNILKLIIKYHRNLKWLYCMFVSKSKSKLEEYIQKKNTISFYILLSLTKWCVRKSSFFIKGTDLEHGFWISVSTLLSSWWLWLLFLSICMFLCPLINCHTSYISRNIPSMSQTSGTTHLKLLKNSNTVKQINDAALQKRGRASQGSLFSFQLSLKMPLISLRHSVQHWLCNSTALT